MSVIGTPQNSQREFFRCLTPNILNNLIQLIKQRHLDDMIQAQIQNKYPRDNIEVVSYMYAKGNSDENLIIQVKKNTIDYFHFSIHLCANSFSNHLRKKKSKPAAGPIHFIENIPNMPWGNKPVITIRVNKVPNKPNSLHFSIAGDIRNASVTVRDDAQIILDILNMYFNESNTNIFINSFYTSKFQNLNKVSQKMNKELSVASVTRKNKNKGYNNINKTKKRYLKLKPQQ